MVVADQAVSRFASLKAHFSHSLTSGSRPPRLHLAAHSHHLWPDVTFAAHMQAWQDAATDWDAKWHRVFEEIIPEAQGHVARHLQIADPASIAFAPNTHELVLRLLSCLPAERAPRVLTTDSEFHSFSRQVARLAEDGLIELETVSAEPFDDFAVRFSHAASRPHDLIFLSHVLFNSGYAVPDLASLTQAVSDPGTLIVIDGYHAFMAVPVDLSQLQHRVFYLGGGYKYAMAGEGACFMICPPGFAPRPRNTGWYAAFGALAGSRPGQVPYATDGGRFMGATFDPSGLYRLNAAMRFLAAEGLGVRDIHARAVAIQTVFVAAVERERLPGLMAADLIVPAGSPNRGNFLAYRSGHAAAQQARLAEAGIITDVRGDVLRIGFGLYHDPDDVPEMAGRLCEALT
jgi:kynureninase